MNLNAWPPGQQPRSRLLDHSTAYPGGDASKKIIAVTSPILLPTLSAKCHDKQAKRPKAQRMAQNFDDSCIVVAVPCVAFLSPSAHPREAESDSFLTCAAKTKQRLAVAGTRPCTLSLSSTIVGVNRVLREILRYSDRKNIDNTYLIRNNTWFLHRTQIRMMCFDHMESNSIRFIKNESFRFQSVLR